MPRGGLRKDSKGTTNHLFTPKWSHGKTVAIRIPEILKDPLISLAEYLDGRLNLFDLMDSNMLVNKVVRYNELEAQNRKYSQEIERLKRERSEYTNSHKSNQNSQKNQQNKYQMAVECFEEFVESKNLNMEELSKSRKGTKKHQMYEINQWLIEKSKISKY